MHDRNPLSVPSATATTAPERAQEVNHHPEYFPVPTKGIDRFFGLPRNRWYELDRSGQLPLIRLRKPGALKGRCFVSFRRAKDFFEKLEHEAVAASQRRGGLAS